MNEQVFISYSSEDMDWAAAIKENLDSNGIPCWMANSGGIAPGENYVEEIMRALDACHVFLLVLSEHAENSPWVSKELGMAISQRKRVIPVKISDYTIDKFRFQLENIQIFQPGNLGEVAEQLKLVNAVKKALDLREVSTETFVPGHHVPPAGNTQKKSSKKLLVPIIAGVAAAAVLVGGIFLGKGLFSRKDSGDGKTPTDDRSDVETEAESEAEKALAAAIEAQQNDPRLHYDGDPRQIGSISLDGSMQTRSVTIPEEGLYFLDISLSPLTYGESFKFNADFLTFDESDLPEDFFDGDATPRHLASVVTLKAGEYTVNTNSLRSVCRLTKLEPMGDTLRFGNIYYKVFDTAKDYTLHTADGAAGERTVYACQEGGLARILEPDINEKDYVYHVPEGMVVFDVRYTYIDDEQKTADFEKRLDAAIEVEQSDPRFHTDADPKTLGLISLDGADQNWKFTVTEQGTYLVDMYLSPLTFSGDLKLRTNFLPFNETGLPKEFLDGKTSQYFSVIVTLEPGEYVLTTNSLRCRPLLTKAEQGNQTYVNGHVYWLNYDKAGSFTLSLWDGTSGPFFAYSGFAGTLLSPLSYKIEGQKLICEDVPAQPFILDMRAVYFDEAQRALDIENKVDAAIAVEQNDPRTYYNGDPKTIGTISRDGSMQTITFTLDEREVYYVEMYLSPLTYGNSFRFEGDLLPFDQTALPESFFNGSVPQYFSSIVTLDAGNYTVSTNSLRCRVRVTKAVNASDDFIPGNIYWMNRDEAGSFTLNFPENTTGTFYTYSGYAGALLSGVSAEVRGYSLYCESVPACPFILDLRCVDTP